MTESGKKLPFPNKFTTKKIVDPYQVFEAFQYAQDNPGVFTDIIVDSVTFLMDQFESQYVLDTTDTMKGWSNFQQFFKKIMQEYVPLSPCRVAFTAHTGDVMDGDGIKEVCVPVKGALKNNGLEAYFSCVIAAKRMPVKKLAGYENDLLHITEREAALGYKHVFQTQCTKYTANERIRTPMFMFSEKETFIDNNIKLVYDRYQEFYS